MSNKNDEIKITSLNNWDKIYVTDNEMKIFKLDKNYLLCDEYLKLMEKNEYKKYMKSNT